jgi:MerR family copper efflux transcriptional regulator
MIQRHEHFTTTEGYTIGEAAQRTGVSAKAIRYYESVGLLPRPLRQSNGYRRYNMADINRLILLRCVRLLGVPLVMAKPLLIGMSDPRCLEVQQELLKLVQKRLTTLDQEIAQLRLFRAELENYQHELEQCHPDESESFSACMDMRCIAFSSEAVQKEENNVNSCSI